MKQYNLKNSNDEWENTLVLDEWRGYGESETNLSGNCSLEMKNQRKWGDGLILLSWDEKWEEVHN